MRIIREQCAACDAYVATAQLKLACIRYDKLIEKDANFTVRDASVLTDLYLPADGFPELERPRSTRPCTPALPSRQDVHKARGHPCGMDRVPSYGLR